jgi:hypothetical protein
MRLFGRVDETMFRTLVLGLLFASGAVLLSRGRALCIAEQKRMVTGCDWPRGTFFAT